jgi:hypothetical protein
MKPRFLLLPLVLCAGADSIARADSVVLYDGADGATCQYFNEGARIKWRTRLGDWRDAKGQPQGGIAYALTTIEDAGSGKVIEWDVTALVRGWLGGAYPNAGLLLGLAERSRSGTAIFQSREGGPAAARPRLSIALRNGQRLQIAPTADTTLDCSTVSSMGEKDTFLVGNGPRAALYFALDPIKGGDVSRATLQLVTADRLYGAPTIAVYRIDPPSAAAPAPRAPGIAANYRGDTGIAKDRDVLMATGFDTPSWRRDWSYVSDSSHVDRIGRDDERKFEPLRGNALRVKIPEGANLGLDMGYNFAEMVGAEPEEIYFRYYLRFADDWKAAIDGGKLPGIAGTYGKAGWGGRKARGEAWSMRGLYQRTPAPGNPLHGLTAVGTYAYHADAADYWGDHWDWGAGTSGLLERNRWYCIEQYFRVNTPGKNDGVFRAWIDDQSVFTKSDIRARDLPSIKIEKIWMNVYHGGTATAPRDLHLYIDNVVVARGPIGCLSR